jgi:hypothetical protein
LDKLDAEPQWSTNHLMFMSCPYFLVHSVEIQDDVAWVDGRLGETSLNIGHLFSRSYPTLQAWQKREGGQPCALVIDKIEAYRRQLNVLSPGMTARLALVGSHISILQSAKVIE